VKLGDYLIIDDSIFLYRIEREDMWGYLGARGVIYCDFLNWDSWGPEYLAKRQII
jgi:hypothetical protein